LLRVDFWYFSPKLKYTVDARNSDSECSGASARELTEFVESFCSFGKGLSGTGRKEASAVGSLRAATE
jgi:hypothetical protein